MREPMRILDRYVLRNFLEPFILCFLAFIGILLIFDLNDNLTDFIGAKAKWKQIGAYYVHQLPQFILLSLPLGLLLALLYSLSKMSRSNEIISMLGAGRSVLRVLAPLAICGLLATGACLWLNYELAPQAEAMGKAEIERLKSEKKADQRATTIGSLLAKDRMTSRLWFARRMRLDQNQLDDVHVTQLDDRGEPVTRWLAQGGLFIPREGKWGLVYGRKVNYDGDGNILNIEDWSDPNAFSGTQSTRSMNTWTETPWRLGSSLMQADQLTVPGLRTYLENNADFPERQLAPFRTNWHYRWALPFTCFTVVFIAAPLGIVFSRRAVLASVASSIFIFFAYLFLMFLFLALGKGGHVSPIVAGWLPNAILLAIGAYLLWLRSTNRELPRLFKR
jgi:lipopolysaccharide export system permease protein